MLKNFGRIIKQMLLYPSRLIKGRMQKSTMKLDEIRPGEGAVVEVEGKKVAVYKNEQGEAVGLSPVCPHLGCVVGWNSAEKTWDCPCHGSRFEADGALKQGPARKGLDKVKNFSE